MNVPELLAPVGSQEALIAAVQNGADAVYLGGKMFSARQYANNFDRDELCRAFEYAHVRGVKVYVTVNTLLADSELAEAMDYLKFLYESGADAIIVQDLGLAGAAHQLLPGLALHASTQMTIHNSGGVESLKEHGFSRVVLARELSLEEVTVIKNRTGMELEVFIHGALCVSYSGQCLMSSMIGGRSGNRGRCAQPCRMEYTLVDEKGKALLEPDAKGRHLLSPRDLNMIRYIPELAKAGVSSLKIEGRMKRPEYVATVTRIYREALDRYKSSPDDYMVAEQDLKDLGQIFNRGFTTGYFFGRQGADMMSFKRPNNRGLRLGRVTKYDRAEKMVEVQLEDSLRIGDGVEFWVTDGGRKGVIVNRIFVGDRPVEEARAGVKAWIPAEGRVRPGDRVFKTHDVELISRAEQSYKSSRELKKIPLNFTVRAHVGQPFEITAADPDGLEYTVLSSFIGQEAITKPLTRESLVKQLDRLGNTPFAVGVLIAEIDGNVMIPASEINETRRRVIEGLAERRAAASIPREPVPDDFTERVVRMIWRPHHAAPKAREEVRKEMRPILTVRSGRMEILTAAVENGAEIIYFGGSNLTRRDSDIIRELEAALDTCRQGESRLVMSTPRIVRESEVKWLQVLLEFALSKSLPVMAANLGTLRLAVKMGLPEIYADFPFNIFNSRTLRWLVDYYGVTQAALSPELTLGQIAGIAGNAAIPLEAVVEGHLPLMVTEYCPSGSLMGDLASGSECRRPCRSNGLRGLRDRMGLVFPVVHDEFCRTHIYNAKELSMIEDVRPLAEAGISRFRLELSFEDRERAAKTIQLWKKELDRFMGNPKGYQPVPEVREIIDAMSPAGLTKGHYYRGVE